MRDGRDLTQTAAQGTKLFRECFRGDALSFRVLSLWKRPQKLQIHFESVFFAHH